MRTALPSLALTAAFINSALFSTSLAAQELPTLELIMSDPDWIGNAPEQAWWGHDGSAIYYRQKREGEDYRDIYRLPLAGGSAEPLTPELAAEAGPEPVYDHTRQYSAWLVEGDLYLRSNADGAVRRVTDTTDAESNPLFLADGSAIAFKRGGSYYLSPVTGGSTRALSDIRFEQDPEQPAAFSPLREQQARIYSTVVEDKRRQLAREAQQRALRAGVDGAPLNPLYLGTDWAEVSRWLSPNGRHLMVVVEKAATAKARAGKAGTMPNYVTAEGPVSTRNVRERVGRAPGAEVDFLLVDTHTGQWQKIDTSKLPGRDRDPLKILREEALDWHVEHGADRAAVTTALKAPELRGLIEPDLHWSPDGSQIAIAVKSADYKDRWIFTVSAEDAEVDTQFRESDEAWINWAYQDFGWLPDGETLWFMSERSGYNHLYTKALDERRPRALTEGDFLVREPAFSPDGSRVWMVANREHPGEYAVYTLSLAGGELQKVTQLDGVSSFTLSPDASQLLISRSYIDRHADLYLQESLGSAEARQLTDTVSARYKAIDWTVPSIVEVPSSHTDRPIYSKLYLPKDYDANKRYPAVMFVHGAGYTQNAHKGWPYYFREFMFHTVLNNAGYVVLDMDYRASQGYGRDWRTTIYRNMGHPELEDYLDGIDYLVDNHNVDRHRVGIYGGSYGGFMTFMALFRAPDAFAAGAALRPVVDWMHYNHSYTSAILNTPLVDPLAYQRSSPINHAEGLSKPLLIAVGMQDDNVFFQDSVLLVQRLIELEKQNFEMAVYPLDGHGFIHPASWLDEYRRIFKLMEQQVKPAVPASP